MERQKKIIDASVLVKIFSEEENSKEATDLIHKYAEKEIIVIVPEFVFLEVTNALRYKKNTIESIQKSSEELLNFQLKIKRLNKDIIKNSIKIAIENDFTIYNSVYIALTETYNCELITADKELAKVPNVKLLKDIDN